MDSMVTAAAPFSLESRPKVTWLTPARCSLALLSLIVATFLVHLAFLAGPCPIDLAEDEAYYWDWSREPDISFYSKGPVTPLLMRMSCEALGPTALAVRLPALFMRAGLSICIFWLTLRLFASHRLALLAMALSLVSPMLIAAGLIMTTDPPFLFCWALACCVGLAAITGQGRWSWILLGAVVGAGFNTKFSMPLWFAGMMCFLVLDAPSRAWLKRGGPWVSILAFLPFTIPVLLWNSRHSWVTFRHVKEDVGVTPDASLSVGNLVDFWLGQAGVVGPLLFLIMAAAAVYAAARVAGFVRDRREETADDVRSTTLGERRALLYLLCMSLPVFVLVFVTSFRKHAAANWPASSYVAMTILAAWFLSTRYHKPGSWRWWRWLLYPAVLLGLGISLIGHNSELVYPLVARYNAGHPDRPIEIRKIDATYRLHGWAEVGREIGTHLRSMQPGTLLMSADYQTTAELAFYVPGQPKTYCAGSYFTDANGREPFSQYDIWLGRRLDRERLPETNLDGRDAIYLGPMNADMRGAFDRVERLPDVVIRRRGLEVRRFEVWKCFAFKGLPWPGWEGRYNK